MAGRRPTVYNFNTSIKIFDYFCNKTFNDMKEMRIFLIAILAGVLVSCSKDTNPDSWSYTVSEETVFLENFIPDTNRNAIEPYQPLILKFNLDKEYKESVVHENGVYTTTMYRINVVAYPSRKSFKQIRARDEEIGQWCRIDGDVVTVCDLDGGWGYFIIRIEEIIHQQNYPPVD